MIRHPTATEAEPPRSTRADDTTFPSDTLTGFTTDRPGIEVYRDGTVFPGPRRLSPINLHSLTGLPAMTDN